jgi:hypothetical protein
MCSNSTLIMFPVRSSRYAQKHMLQSSSRVVGALADLDPQSEYMQIITNIQHISPPPPIRCCLPDHPPK